MPVVARPPQRQNPAILAAAATRIQINRVLYFAVVPVFGIVLLVLAVRKGFNSGKHSRSAYAFIASLSVLSGLVGSLGSHAQVEAIIQAFLSVFLCIPVLHLTSVHNTTARDPSRCQFTIRTLLKSLLCISLSSATLLTLLNHLLTSKLPPAVHPSIPTTLFFAYTIFALGLLVNSLCLKFRRVDPATLSAGTRRPAIDIHVSTAVSINLTRSSCFSAPDLREQIQGTKKSNNFSAEHAEHQKRPSVDSGISIISAFKSTNFVGSPQPSRVRRGTEFRTFTVLQFRTRAQDLLPFLCLILAQLALCASHACRFAFDDKATSPVLETIHHTLNVVSIMASMKAYLLHAYNTHLGSLGLPARRYSNGTTPNLVSDASSHQTTPIDTPPIPPKSLTSPVSSVLGHRLRVEPSLDPVRNTAFNPQSTTSGRNRTTLQATDGNEKGQDSVEGRLVNSVSVGSLKSAYETGGSEESDQTRVESSVESDIRGNVGTRVGGLKGIQPHDICQRVVENLEVHTNKRGSIPAPPENYMPKKLLGFGWLHGMTNRYRERRGEKDFIDMRERRCGMKSSVPPSLPHTVPLLHSNTKGREPRKLKRSATIAAYSLAASTIPSPASHPPSAFAYAYWNSDSTLFKTSSSDLETDMNMGNIVPVTTDQSPSRKLAKKRSCENVFSEYGLRESPDKSRCDEDKIGGAVRGRTSSPGGLRLKRSFKMDDGRTLSPRLTLAAAIAGEVCTPGPYFKGVDKFPLVEGESISGNHWETQVEGGHELEGENTNPDGGLAKEMWMGSVRSSRSDGQREDRNALPSPKTSFSPSLRERRNIELHPDSVLFRSRKLAPKPHAAPEKSGKRPWMNIKMNSHNDAQRPLEVSLQTVFIPATSEALIGESISPITPTERTAVKYPPTPSEPPSCSSSTTASPLVPDRIPMIFRSSISDQSHGQRSSEAFPLARVSSSPAQRTHNIEPPITPTRGQSNFSSSSSSLRLSAVTIEGVKSAFSGVWSAKRNGRAGGQQSPISPSSETMGNRESMEASTFSGVVILEDDDDGDFMDLRDPFASPRAGKVRRIPSGGCAGMASVDSSEDGHGESCRHVSVTAGGFRRKMSTWGRLPVTPPAYSYPVRGQREGYSLTGSESRAYFSRIGDVPQHAKSKEHRRERRARKRMPKMPMTKLPVLDDVDFDIEEALLTQRLLKRLDDDMHGEVRVTRVTG